MVVVERDPERLRSVVDDFDVMGVAGSGAARRVLDEANVAGTKILIAVTDGDEVNMIACMAAKHAGVPLTIARIRNPDYLDANHSVSSDHRYRPGHSTRVGRGRGDRGWRNILVRWRWRASRTARIICWS